VTSTGGRPPGPPRAHRTNLLAFRAAAAVFAASTAFFVWFFVYELVAKDQIRTGVATYGLVTALTAIGLWRARTWGRTLALLISLSSAGLGTLTLLSVIFSREGSPIVPVIVLVTSGAFAFWLSRPAFEIGVSDHD
jgi:hypothetical protein